MKRRCGWRCMWAPKLDDAGPIARRRGNWNANCAPFDVTLVQETPKLRLAIWPRSHLFIEPPPADHDASHAERETAAAKEKHDDVPERTRFDERAPIPTVGRRKATGSRAAPGHICAAAGFGARQFDHECLTRHFRTILGKRKYDYWHRTRALHCKRNYWQAWEENWIEETSGRRYVQDSASQLKARAHRSFGMLRPSMML